MSKEKKPQPSLELTDPEGLHRAREAGSYIKVDGELQKVAGTVSPALFADSNDVAVDETATEESEPDQETSDQEDVDLQEVISAISLLDEQDVSLWTKQSGPKVSALTDLLGYPVSEEIRNDAWAAFQLTLEN